MSKLPTVEQRPIPQAAPYSPQDVVVVDNSPLLKAQAQLGESLIKTGDAIQTYEYYDQRRAHTAAKAQFLDAAVKLENQIEQESDVENAPKKYQEGIAKIKQQLLENNKQYPAVQQAIGYDITRYSDSKINALQKIAQQRVFSQQQVEAENTINGLVGSYLNAKDDFTKQQILKTAIDTYENSISPNDPRKPELAQKGKDAIVKRFIDASFLTKPPLEQMRLLDQEKQNSGSTIASFLPADQREEIYQKAQIAYKNQLKEAEAEKEKALKQSKLKRDEIITEAAISGKSFPVEFLLSASKSEQENYYAIRNKQIGLGKFNPTEEEIKYDEYQNLYISNPDTLANIPVSEIYKNVPTDKINQVIAWKQKAIAKVEAPITDKMQVDTTNQTLTAVGVNLNTEEGKAQRAKFNASLQQQISYFKDAHKKEPTYSDLQKMAHGLVVKATFDGFWRNKDKYLFQVDKNEINDIIVPESFTNQLIIEARNAKMKPLSPEQIKQAYINKIKNGR